MLGLPADAFCERLFWVSARDFRMSYRRRILSRLKDFYDKEGPPGLLILDPIDILGKPGNQKYVAAINQLLAEGLILGKLGGESNKPAFAPNPDKINDIEKELRWYSDPALQFLVGSLIAASGLAWAIIKWVFERP